MRMTLERLRMENFKGIKSLEVVINPYKTSIMGANGTGKTTIVDAFTWVLFNQNANGDAPGSDNFREKPLDENGNVIHNLDTTVELACTLDGARFDLKRTQSENWVKKRGNAQAVFQGNVSKYWINGVEMKQQDFMARINAIADKEVLRLVSGLSAFNMRSWQNRRQQLLNLAGNDVDDALLARDEYRQLADEIAERNVSPDDLRKVFTDQRKAINKELLTLPVRIDEAQKSMPVFKPHEVEDAEYIIADTKKDIEKIEQAIIDARSQSGEGANRMQVLALEQECISIKRRIYDEHEAERQRLKREADAASDVVLNVSAQFKSATDDAIRLDRRIEDAQKDVDALRAEYMDVKRKAIDVAGTCPTCGQPLPQDKLDEIRKAAENGKREKLQTIQQKGKRAADDVKKMQADRAELADRIAELEVRSKAAQDARNVAMSLLRDYPGFPSEEASKPLLEAEKRLEALRTEQSESPAEKVRELTERKREMLAIVDRNLTVLNKRDLMLETQQRVKAYEARQQELGAQLSDTEIKLALVERFIQDRCGALEESINSHFPTVRWKLFDQQINGGLVDTCVCMIDCDGVLVPYDSANTASQIRADIEIVDVLSKHYDVRVPLFIDNAERVNTLPEIESQTITLAVSNDYDLKVV